MNVHKPAPAPAASPLPGGLQPLPPRPACTTTMWSPAPDVLQLSTQCVERPGAYPSHQALSQQQVPALRTPALRVAVGAWLDSVAGLGHGPRPSIVRAVETTTHLPDLVALRRFFRLADATAMPDRGGAAWTKGFAPVGEALDRRIAELQPVR